MSIGLIALSLYSNGTIMAPFDPTSNETVSATRLVAYVQNSTLHVSGFVSGETYGVYNVSGALIYTGIANSDRAEIALSGRGVYIVRTVGGKVKVTH